MKKETPICHHCARPEGVKKHGIGNTGNQRYFLSILQTNIPNALHISR
ncbi:Uncharacterised protein [Budvicia aquatica]|uniref:Uncharacterized protein n=1 Tax=Budvicia aquatica TaxID=82979 RepID=A0A484ZN29_9GAMM|nr:Uncharacterised protein [Budvicia aquatica]